MQEKEQNKERNNWGEYILEWKIWKARSDKEREGAAYVFYKKIISQNDNKKKV